MIWLKPRPHLFVEITLLFDAIGLARRGEDIEGNRPARPGRDAAEQNSRADDDGEGALRAEHRRAVVGHTQGDDVRRISRDCVSASEQYGSLNQSPCGIQKRPSMEGAAFWLLKINFRRHPGH